MSSAIQPNRLREWRLRTRHSQIDVAKFLGTTSPAVNRHEQGARGLTDRIVRAYANLYKVPTYALFLNPVGHSIPPNQHRLVDLRKNRRLNIEEAARAAGMDTNLLIGLETGKEPFGHEDILRLASLYKVPTYLLFTDPVLFQGGIEESVEETAVIEPDDTDSPFRPSADPYSAPPLEPVEVVYAEYEGGFAGHTKVAAGR